MEIGPIVGIRFNTIPRSQASEMKAPSIFDIDSLERMGSESFKTTNQESHGGMHDEDADLGEDEDDGADFRESQS